MMKSASTSPETGDARFRSLIENAADIITIVDPDGTIRYESPSADRVLGYEGLRRLQRSLFDFVHPEDLRDLITAFTTALEVVGRNVPLEYRCRHRDGSWIILEGTAKSLLEDPAIAGVVINSREITQRKRAEEEQKRLTVVMDSSPDFVGTADPHGRLSYVNRAGRMLVGLEPQAVTAGVNITDIHPPRVNEVLLHEGIPTAMREGVWTGETALLGRNGREITVLEAILAHKSADGTVEFLSMIARDITERKMLESELRQAQRVEAMGHLAAGIAHEINTPIQYLGDNIRFLAESFNDLADLVKLHQEFFASARVGDVPPQLVEALDASAADLDVEFVLEEFPRAVAQSLEGVENVAEIVRAMKEFSHPGTAEKTPTDINRTIQTTLTVSRSEWKYVAEVCTDLDPELPLVPCLPGDFNQALLNIVVNAAHAIADAVQDGKGPLGVIRVTTARQRECVEIRIFDSGPGIPEAIQPHIFDPFFTTKEVGRGTGQGLTLARNVIVDRHGGTLTFETEPGCGTTFIVRLPLAPKTTSQQEAA